MRKQAVSLSFIIFSISIMLFSLATFVISDAWYLLIIVFLINFISLVPLFGFSIESFKWLIEKGKTKAALKMFKKISKINGKDITPKELNEFKKFLHGQTNSKKEFELKKISINKELKKEENKSERIENSPNDDELSIKNRKKTELQKNNNESVKINYEKIAVNVGSVKALDNENNIELENEILSPEPNHLADLKAFHDPQPKKFEAPKSTTNQKRKKLWTTPVIISTIVISLVLFSINAIYVGVSISLSQIGSDSIQINGILFGVVKV